MNKKQKVETIQEYLARGGKISILPSKEATSTIETLKQDNSGPVTILSLEEAELLYGKGKTLKPKKRKQYPKLDVNALPAHLREKLLMRLKNEGIDDEFEDQEELEDEEDSEDEEQD